MTTAPNGTSAEGGHNCPTGCYADCSNAPTCGFCNAYGPRPTEVTGSELEALLERVERYFVGTAPPHSQFWLAEFRDEHHHVMLVIQEAC